MLKKKVFILDGLDDMEDDSWWCSLIFLTNIVSYLLI